jgi:hypothetical protein
LSDRIEEAEDQLGQGGFGFVVHRVSVGPPSCVRVRRRGRTSRVARTQEASASSGLGLLS